MHTLYDIHSFCSHAKAENLDRLITFLLMHFEKEVEQQKTYNEISSENVQSDYTLPDIVSTLDVLIQNLNYLKHNTEELDTRTISVDSMEHRISNIENDMQSLMSRVIEIEKKLSSNK